MTSAKVWWIKQTSHSFQFNSTMKLTLILLLFLWDNVEFTLTHEECSVLPTVPHAFVLDEYKKPQYQKGDVIYFSCDPGYTTGLNTTYVCTEHGWRAATIGQCIEDSFPVRLGCTHPPALKNGYLVRNFTYVYSDGENARYQCERLYELKGGHHKTCSNGQWIGDLRCQEITCKLSSEGTTFSLIFRPGQTVTVSCGEKQWVKSRELQSAELTCQDTGRWDYEPVCKDISCPRPESPRFEVQGDKSEYRKDEVLRYSCNRGYLKVDGRPSVCREVGQSAEWSPMPQCEPVACKLSPDPPEGTEYSPRNQIIFDHGQTLTVSCGDKHYVKSRELQSADLTCQDTGKWDSEPPVCKAVTCSRRDPNVYEWQRDWYRDNTVFMDQTLWYRCHREFKATGQRDIRGTATCTRGGWEPNPLCKEKGCSTRKHLNAEISDNYQKDEYEHSERVRFRCTYDDPIVEFEYLCHYGEWIYSTRDFPQPRCKERPCMELPRLDNAEMLPNQREQAKYEHGDSLLFRCIGETNPFRVTCQRGRWTTHKRCEDPSPLQ